MPALSTAFGNNVIGPMAPVGPLRLWDCGVTWADLEPVHNRWHWDTLDTLVDQANGRHVMLVLGHPAAWAARTGPDGKQAPWLAPGANRPAASVAIWNNYVMKVATRYKGRIHQYQIWNEPLFQTFYSGSYATLAYHAYAAKIMINRIDPHAKIISYPLQPSSASPRSADILDAYEKYKFPFDIWAMHVYPKKGEGINGWTRDAKRGIQWKENRAPSKPIWVTETNYNLLGEGNPFSPDKQLMLLNMTRARAMSLDIPRVYWYGYGHSQPELFGINQTF